MTGRAGSIVAALAVAVSAAVALVGAEASSAATLPSGFTEQTVFSGLNAPVNFRFAADGRVFVAQKGGVDQGVRQPQRYHADDRRRPQHRDHRLLGPRPARARARSELPGEPVRLRPRGLRRADRRHAPRWNDNCPTPPGPTTDGCVVSGRLLQADALGQHASTTTKILIKDQWCQQFPSHSIGDLNFGADGALYVSGGDGASFNFADYGQGGGSAGSPTPKNPCGDPPAGVGGTMTPPTAEGGALRAQSLRRPSGQPVLLNGAVLRVDPATGDALPDNPLAAKPGRECAPDRRLRLPQPVPLHRSGRCRTSSGSATSAGTTGRRSTDSRSPTSAALNFGWPCYEGQRPTARVPERRPQSAARRSTAPGPRRRRTSPTTTAAHVVAGDSCPTGSSAITGLAFYTGASNYPASYNNGLFFADYARNCISFMPVGTNGLPDPTQVQPFESSAAGPVDLEIGPNGDIFYADLEQRDDPRDQVRRRRQHTRRRRLRPRLRRPGTRR